MLTGLNHVTLAVSDLARSIGFYHLVLGFRLAASWDRGAYLSLDGLWLCLSLDSLQDSSTPRKDYTHYAFSIPPEALPVFRERLRASGATEWKQNSSEGDSVYFLDPDGHKLEAHVGDLASRLEQCRLRPYAGMKFFD